MIPAEVKNEVLEFALQKANTEDEVRKAIEGGMTTTEAFAHIRRSLTLLPREKTSSLGGGT